MPWVTDEAPTTAELDSCVSCGLCLPHCPTFRLTGDETASPRGRLAAMSAVAADASAVDHVFAEIMGLCLQCRACEVVCPSLVPFGRAMEGARAEITAQLPSRGRRVRHFLLGRGARNATYAHARVSVYWPSPSVSASIGFRSARPNVWAGCVVSRCVVGGFRAPSGVGRIPPRERSPF